MDIVVTPGMVFFLRCACSSSSDSMNSTSWSGSTQRVSVARRFVCGVIPPQRHFDRLGSVGHTQDEPVVATTAGHESDAVRGAAVVKLGFQCSLHHLSGLSSAQSSRLRTGSGSSDRLMGFLFGRGTDPVNRQVVI
ncbi:hypothetical protein FKR81_05200 [Lentzea tibetensis]|uniref:Uncharacterized protein n=1 Tax=Lentzea tibetensis TaxID=2591470 RepID=A0A563F061_9PSEU|nr:hypothetical protein [Lentzea tibetensis]TWP53365.1 hypothetical protein FKR81_05200 [Lentzea tibetensis]